MIFKLFANRMVNGFSPILQRVEKVVDCPTHQKSITLDWLEVVRDIFPVTNKFYETNSTNSMVSIKKNLVLINFSVVAHFLCKSGYKAIDKRGRLSRAPTIRCTSQGWTELSTKCVQVGILTSS